MLNILIILSIVLSAGLFYFGMKVRVARLPIFSFRNSEKAVLIKNKFLGMDLTTTEFLQQTKSIKEEAKKYASNDKLSEIVNIFNDFEKNYHYTTDGITIEDGEIKIISDGPDTWMPAPVTLKMIHQNGAFYGDCEDGTFFTVALYNALDIEAYANVGTLTLNDNVYGHSWVTVVYNGVEYPVETTQGAQITKLLTMKQIEENAKKRGYSLEYKTQFRFNIEKVDLFTGEDINKQPIYPPLPPSKVIELRRALGG